jgi:hypothetical protein
MSGDGEIGAVHVAEYLLVQQFISLDGSHGRVGATYFAPANAGDDGLAVRLVIAGLLAVASVRGEYHAENEGQIVHHLVLLGWDEPPRDVGS